VKTKVRDSLSDKVKEPERIQNRIQAFQSAQK